jgi:hypothetical protein
MLYPPSFICRALSNRKFLQRVEYYNRLKRIDGKSKMNLTSPVHHAFKSFVEYAEELLMVNEIFNTLSSKNHP